MIAYRENYSYCDRTFTADEAFSRGAEPYADGGGKLEHLERQIEALTTLTKTMFGLLAPDDQTAVLKAVGFTPVEGSI